MKVGDQIHIISTETPTGLPLYMGEGRLVRKVGTIPDFWEVEYLEGPSAGSHKNIFVHPEDQEPQTQSLPLIALGSEDQTPPEYELATPFNPPEQEILDIPVDLDGPCDTWFTCECGTHLTSPTYGCVKDPKHANDHA
jgi:hypothetical protein